MTYEEYAKKNFDGEVLQSILRALTLQGLRSCDGVRGTLSRLSRTEFLREALDWGNTTKGYNYWLGVHADLLLEEGLK